MRTNAIFAALMLAAAGWAAAAPDNAPDLSADIVPAPAIRSAAATSQLAVQQRAAMDEARRLMEKSWPVPEPAVAATANTAPKPSGSNPAIILLILAVALLLAGAGMPFRLGRAPLETEPAAGGPPKIQDDASIIRAALDSSEKSAPTAGSVNAINPRFMKLLISNRIISAEERTSLENRFQGDHFAIMLYLIEQRPQTRDAIARLWGDSLDCAYTNPVKTILQTELLEKLPKDFARKNNIIPLSLAENVATVAMSDPGNTGLQRQVENHIDCLVCPVFVLPAQIQQALEIAQTSLLTIKDQLSAKLAGSAYEGSKIAQLAADKTIAEFVRSLFILALKQRASDIHIEPRDTGVDIRLRIDGALQEYLQIPTQLFPAVSNVIKIMAEADIGERRRPQDGRITVKLHDRELKFRFACTPTIYGEKIVLRLLGQNQFASVPRLEDLNFSRPILAGVRRIIESPNGIFFVTGPTGSGKTTTLYAALKELNRKDANIMTIEDPVEYRLKGVNQVQVNPLSG